ncbi:unnamed protein product [Brachionus calyciflorus]|uniref:Uncharacterized protein n=1 Tax=Brachionus calyciflorus TaxID=104777 RepID=A0A813NSS7_9BILA|nr:unnamed protein product [Brachionus calyciflorus]
MVQINRCLGLVPIEKSDLSFEIIMANKPSINSLDKFLDYFFATYFEGSYTINMWNHFETYDSPRTNNNLEGYNYKLNRHIRILHPNIFKAIDKLKEEEVDLSIDFSNIIRNKPGKSNISLSVSEFSETSSSDVSSDE